MKQTTTNRLKILLYIVFGLVVFGGAVLAGVQIAKKQLPSKEPVPSLKPTTLPTSTPSECYYQEVQCFKAPCDPVLICPSPGSTTPQKISGDLIMGIQTNTCCSCPTKIPVAQIGTDGWVKYELGKNYSSQLPEECNLVDCAPCPPPGQ